MHQGVLNSTLGQRWHMVRFVDGLARVPRAHAKYITSLAFVTTAAQDMLASMISLARSLAAQKNPPWIPASNLR
jgi:hypothetical protein